MNSNGYLFNFQAPLDDQEFFDFTFVDIGAEDLTAQVDFVLEKTGQEKVFWFGMSQGELN